MNEADGRRIAVHPEHKESSFNGVRNVIRWRNQNMPGTEVWVTEWGWDSDGVTETCENSECVTEKAQALYGIRGFMILTRSGVDVATWYFFANTKSCNTLFCRSGLTGSSNVNFQKKKVFIAFQALFYHIGDAYFQDIIKEDDTAYVYSVGLKRQNNRHEPTHFIAWTPTEADDTKSINVSFSSPRRPKMAWMIDGSDPYGTQVPNPGVSANTWTVTVSATPVLIELL